MGVHARNQKGKSPAIESTGDMTFVSTNPCGEQQPYAWSKCSIGPLAVGRCYGKGGVGGGESMGDRNRNRNQLKENT